MIWYLINIFIITLIWIVQKNDIIISTFLKNRIIIGKNKMICIIGSLNWIILSGFRNISVGADTYSYKVNFFDKIDSISWNKLLNDVYNKYILRLPNMEKDLGYRVFEKIFHFFSNTYQLYLIFIAIIFFILMGKFIYKYSKNVYLSYILFSCLFYSFYAITGLRQTIATALVVFCGIDLIKERKFYKFVFLIMIASTIHASALCFLPFYWISRINISSKMILVYWGLIIGSFLFKNQVFNVFRLISGYDNYEFYSGATGGTFLLLLLLLALFSSVFYKKIIDDQISSISLNALFVSCIFSSMLLINPACMRVIQYYSIFLILLLPKCQYIFVNEYRRIFNFIVSSALILLLILNNPTYSFFWMS